MLFFFILSSLILGFIIPSLNWQLFTMKLLTVTIFIVSLYLWIFHQIETYKIMAVTATTIMSLMTYELYETETNRS